MNYVSRSIVLTALVVAVFYLLFSLALLGLSVRSALYAKDSASALQLQIQSGDYEQAFEEVFALQKQLGRASFLAGFSGWVRAIPAIRHDYTFYADLLSAGNRMTSLVTDTVEGLSGENPSRGLSLQSLDHTQLLSILLSKHGEMTAAMGEWRSAIDAASQLHLSLYPQSQQPRILSLQASMTEVGALLNDFQPAISALPELLGAEDPQELLVLLQNPDELRPTGGFIGTIGRITINEGDIISIETDDIYSVDVQVLGREQLEAPLPIQQYANVPYWYLRDANWSPDFPTTAQNVKTIYEYESGQQGIDTVIGVTPFVIEQFLDITGPVIVGGIEFNATNLIDALQYRVEQEFWRIGVSEADRKAIINDLAQALKQRLFTLSPSQLGRLADVSLTALRQKEILIYSVNHDVEQTIRRLGFAGEVVDIGADYLYVVDANLGALKTDRVMQRTRQFSLKPEQGRWKASVNLVYTNNGFFDYRTTRYRTYVRVYVPIGSELVNVRGAMLTDRTTLPGKADITQEFNKTVFGAFLAIEPGETRNLLIEYYLPEWLVQQFKASGRYELYVQKQPGVENQLFVGDLAIESSITAFSPSTTDYQIRGERRVTFTEEIFGDNLYRLEFAPAS